ncbi:MAG: hypothetical protein ABH808_03040 [Candidatus Kuenenbacteria bacterium]
MTNALVSQKVVDEKIEELQKLFVLSEKIKPTEKIRLEKVEKYKDKDILENKVILEKQENIIKIDNAIKELELYIQSEEAKNQIVKLQKAKEDLESQITAKQQQIKERCEKGKTGVMKHLAKQEESISEQIEKIKEDPTVAARLEGIKTQKQKEEDLIEEEKQKNLNEQIRKTDTESIIQSLSAQHENAFKQMEKILGEKNTKELYDYKQSKLQQDKFQLNPFDKAQIFLINEILYSETLQIKDFEKMVPWKTGIEKTWIDPNTDKSHEKKYGDEIYGNKMDELNRVAQMLSNAKRNRNKLAEKLLIQQEQILKDNKIIKRLVGPQKDRVDQNTKRKYLKGVFWLALEERKRYEQKQKEKNIKEDDIKKDELEQEKKNKRLDEFAIKTSNGAIVFLEKIKFQKGNEGWRVFKILRETKEVTVEHTSTLDMKSFPKWLQISADSYLEMRKKNK